jgi:formylglycine-generating enzyme required for sulfatase activity
MENGEDSYLGKVFGDFRIESEIGAGAMGTVYRATQISLDRHVALKILPPKFIKSHPDFVERFLREAKVAGQISHPNIVQVHAAGSHEGVFYIAMELVRGHSIGDILIKRGPLAEKKALSIISQAVKGLAAGEQLGLVHRDIKPDNLLLTKDGIVKVADFGLAKISGVDSMVTQAGQILGTPSFMSPEQARSQSLDSRSDIYSLGATLYQMLTGVPPYSEENPLLVLMKHCDEPVPDPKALREDLSDFTTELVQTMMAKDPAERFQSFVELGSMLRQKPEDLGDHVPTRLEMGPGGGGPTVAVRSSSGVRDGMPTARTLAGVLVVGRRKWLWAAVGVPLVVAGLAAALWFSGVLGGGAESKGTARGKPFFRITEPQDGAFVKSAEVSIKGTFKGAGNPRITVNGRSVDREGSKFAGTVPLDKQGRHVITVAAETPKGEIREILRVILDSHSPSIEVEGIRPGERVVTKEEVFSFRGKIRDAHPAGLKVNGTAATVSDSGTFSAKTVPVSKGETPVVLDCTDKAGNHGNFTFRLVLDTKPPTITLLAPKEGRVFGAPNPEIRIRFSEPVTAVKIDGREGVGGEDAVFSLRLALVEGANDIRIQAADLAGNAVDERISIAYQRFDPEKLEAERSAWEQLEPAVRKEGPVREKIALVVKFLETFPEGKLVGKAEELLTALKRVQEEEEAAYQEACKDAVGQDSPREKIRILQRFLDRYPFSARAEEVKSQMEAARTEALPLKAEGIVLGDRPGTFMNQRDGAVLVHVPAGEFLLGREDGPPDEGPAIPVRLSGFYIYVHEVTNVMYAKFLASAETDGDSQGTPFIRDSLQAMEGRFPWGLTRTGGEWVPVKGYENHPVIFVTWHGASAYAAWAGTALPTEAQWERAARGEEGRPFPWGDGSPGKARANIANLEGRTLPVGSLLQGKSPAGCLDMAGNVQEWCRDTFTADFLKTLKAKTADPFHGGAGERSLRGGSWFHTGDFARATCRSVRLNPAGSFPTVGFRCVKR